MWLQRKADQLIKWYTNRSTWSKLIVSLPTIIILLVGGVSITIQTSDINLQILNQQSFPMWFTILLIIILTLLLGYAMISENNDKKRKHILMLNKKLLVIEQRGLKVGGNDDPLIDKINDIYPAASTINKLIDVRNCYGTNSLFNPECAIIALSNIKNDVESLLSTYNKSDTAVIYGGISPVPITFLTGFLLDDEFRLDVYDWDRTNQKWFQIEDNDKLEPEKFKISDIESIENNDEIVFKISVSYSVDHQGIDKLFPSLPKIDLTFNSIDKDNHWNLKTQKQLMDAFLATLKLIGQKGIKKVHLFIAAQNSVVFNLARIYDQRNLPVVYVYQYERSFDPPYAWSIQMPSHGINHPKVIKIEAENSMNNNNT